LALWHPRLGIAISIIVTNLLFLAALPVIGARMLEGVEMKPQDRPDFSAAQAIVVLGGGLHRGDGDKTPDTLGPWSLERIDYAAHAYKQLNLRILVSGGWPQGAYSAEATLMKTVLEADFGVPVNWVENRSRTTWENAVYSKEMLAPEGINTVVLVTNAWHMRRAVWAFERVGLHAIPYPAPLTYGESDRAADFLPSVGALEESYHALHEAIGLAYYRLRY
jgi:uncharacterized SAM-binding protein YcdF (DUF218 family)